MANVVYRMGALNEFLHSQQFTLYMDNQLQPELSQLHKRILAWLRAAALQYNFVIQDKSGSGLLLLL